MRTGVRLCFLCYVKLPPPAGLGVFLRALALFAALAKGANKAGAKHQQEQDQRRTANDSGHNCDSQPHGTV